VVLATLDFIVSLAVQHHHLLDMERARYSPIGEICLTGSYCPLGSSLPIYVQLVLLTIILKLHQYLIAPTVLLDTFVKDSGIHNQVVSVKKAPIVCWDRPLLLLFKSLTILFLEIILEEISVQLIIIVLQAPLMLVVVHLEPIIMLLVKVTVSFVLQATFVLLKRLILYDCPIGYYCSNGTEYATQFPCPS